MGRLRAALVSEARLLSDAVICGHDRDHVGALAWVNAADVQRVLGVAPGPEEASLSAYLVDVLDRLGARGGSAMRIQRLLLLTEPPDIDAGEITDKGYINQRAVLKRRAADVERLFREPVAPGVIVARPASSPSK